MKRFNCIKILLLLFALQHSAYSQNLDRRIQKEKNKIEKFFLKDLPWENSPDSSMIIGFSFKITVQKLDKRAKSVINISANDSIAYKLFPKYESLRKIDFELFMKEKHEADFIIPVLIEIVGSRQDNLTDEMLIDFMNKRIFFTTIKHDPRLLFHMIVDGSDHIENYRFIKPVFIVLNKRKAQN